jgi:hypothetical protein
MSASEINGLARFIQRSFCENAAVTNFLFLPSGQLVLQTCGGPQISGRDGMMFVMTSSRISCLGTHMGEVVQFIPKRDLERVRIIREARAIYDRIVPPEGPATSLQSRNRFYDE